MPAMAVGAAGVPVNVGELIAAAPRLVLADAASVAPVPPATTAMTTPVIVPPVMVTALAFCELMVPKLSNTAVIPRLFLAPNAVLAPVPPAATAIGDTPVMVPPVMVTALAFCTAMVPTVVVAPDAKPRLVLAPDAVLDPVPPSTTAKGFVKPVTVPLKIEVFSILPPVICMLFDTCVAMLPKPRLVLAPDAVLDPVPPDASGNADDKPVMVPPVICTLLDDCVAMSPKPRLVLAPAAVLAPVPPDASGMADDKPVMVPPVMATAPAS